MAKKHHMTWYASGRRWRKCVGGKWYSVSCRQLGVPETKEASWRAANEWWEREQGLLGLPSEDERLTRAAQVSRLVQDFGKLDEDARKSAVEALLGVGEYDRLRSQSDAILAGMDAASPQRTVSVQVESWKTLLRSACQSGQLSEGRYDAYERKIKPFVRWIGPDCAIDAIDEAKLEDYFNHLSSKVREEAYSPSYAHELLMTAKQFIARLAEMKLLALPGNIRSRRFRFNHSAASRIETFTVGELRELLEAATQRTRLYLLLMLNCGMYQNDIAELRDDEVDWRAGTVTRRRSKTRERNAPIVTYRLWPETLVLLKRHKSGGPLVLTTDEGNPLVRYSLDGEKFSRYDVIQSAWTRLAEKLGKRKHRLGMKHLRKTSSTLLGEHPRYKFYTTHFLADSPKGMTMKHYVVPSDAEFFESLEWLRSRILSEGGQPSLQGLLDEEA